MPPSRMWNAIKVNHFRKLLADFNIHPMNSRSSFFQGTKSTSASQPVSEPEAVATGSA
jgi:hypothetical protein